MTDNMGTFFFTCTYRLILRYLDACLYTVFKSEVIVNMKLGIQRKMLSRLVQSRTQFMGTKFGIFGGFGYTTWICNPILLDVWLDETGFGKSQVFLDLGCFEIVQRFGQRNIGQNSFEVRYISSSMQFEILNVFGFDPIIRLHP